MNDNVPGYKCHIAAQLLGRTRSSSENLGRGREKFPRMKEEMKNVDKYANASVKGVSCP